jgi:hypothetical protein
MERYIFRKRRSPRAVRDLMPGDIVAGRTISRVELLDGLSGDEPTYISGEGGRTAVAFRIHFDDGGYVVAHPNDVPPSERTN